MAVKLSGLKKWTTVPLDGGGSIKVRAQGQEFFTAYLNAIRDARAALGLTDKLTKAEAAEMEKLGTLATSGKTVMNDAEEEKLGRENIRLARVVSVGTTFGGFSDFIGEDEQPISDTKPDGSLDVDMCVALLEIDEINDAWITARNRLTRERDARWEGAKGN